MPTVASGMEPASAVTVPADLSVIILTLNEAGHIARAIESVRTVAARIFVVDAFSTDGTDAIAAGLGAVVVQHPFENYARQFQWALSHLPVSTGWILRLDADEVVTPELAAELARTLPALPAEVTGLVVPLSYVFLGRAMRHGGRRLKLLRIVRRDAAAMEDRWMDEHLVLTRGRTRAVTHGLIDDNRKGLGFFIDKHNGYATREAMDVLVARYGLASAPGPTGALAPAAARTRAVKKNLYYGLPFGVGPALYFFYRYVVRLGFLDGVEGLIYHVLQGLWYRVLVECKIREYDRPLGPLPGRSERLRALQTLTGHVLL